MTFDQLLHLISTQRLTPRQYARVMRRFRKGALRAVGLALPLVPLHFVGGAMHVREAAPYGALLAVLAGASSALMLMSLLGMAVAWTQAPRRLRASNSGVRIGQQG